MEQWKPIPGYEKIYSASDLGRIKREARVVHRSKYGDLLIPEKLLEFSEDKDGYLKTALRDSNGNRKHYRVHRLVAMTFLENHNNLPVVNHKDGDKRNNCVANLEWATISENTKHGFDVLGRVLIRNDCKKQAVKLDKRGIIVEIFDSITEAAERHNVSIQAISNAARNKTMSCGHYWLILDEGVTTIETAS
ncbi:NUMOD4 domain-containing protein [Bacillus paralicheniformis]|uniref:NUMOD4 domain-containing protein n=1 Tax=Bacillus paralicheniformis TaxID=1648923 RepID=A0AAW6KN31_9BACI|nr:NUMOD4 domain-containing protein [Bacillus paralicheniformis]MDE1454876.1 NUMOD4 domain-containing protein [Bacillus paralicheniformis]